MKRIAFAICTSICLTASAQAQSPSRNAIPVTVDNFKRAETDMYLAGFVKEGAFRKFIHHRELPVENTGVRPNRDTLYSFAVFDLEAGPVTITLPNAGKRFMSLMVINQDHYALETVYTAGDHTYTRELIGTRYLFAAVRTLVDPANSEDVKQAQALQDATKISQPGGTGSFEVPNWDQASQKKVRDALLVLNEMLPEVRNAGGRNGEGANPRDNASIGFVTAEYLEGLLSSRDADYYFCGPQPFMVSIYHELLKWGIPASQVHFEFFGPRQELERAA